MKLKVLLLIALGTVAIAGTTFAGGRCGGGRGWGGSRGYCGPGWGGGGPYWGGGGWGGPSFGISVVSAPVVPVYRTVYVNEPVYINQPAPAPAYYSQGYPPPLVAQAQVRLARMGYYGGKIDGDFGPRTNQAIVLYQQDYGLPVTGRLDRRTRASLGV